MKPQMWLDSKLPKTRSAPIGPDGEVDWPRLNKLEEFRFLYAYDTSDGEPREEYRAAWEALRAGFTFRDIPLFMAHHVIMGSGAAARAYASEKNTLGFVRCGVPPVIESCHPDTWAAMPEEFRAEYDVKTEEERQAECNNFAQPCR